MEKTHTLHFKNEIKYALDNESDIIEFETEASFIKKNEKYFVSFKYPKEFMTKATSAVIKIENGKVTSTDYFGKNSAINSHVFIKDTVTKESYQTEFGNIPIEIITNKIISDLDENGGKVKVSYKIYHNESLSSTTNLTLNISKNKEN